MNHIHATSGERLAAVIHDEHLSNAPWNALASALGITGRAEFYARYFRELTAVAVACRLVAYASGLSERGNDGEPLDQDDPVFQRTLLRYIRESLGVHDTEPQGKLVRQVIASLEAAKRGISKGTKNLIKNPAKRQGAVCYLCGQVLTFESENVHSYITIDHIWPQCFGGESELENLLPACLSCNTSKKKNFATWSMVAVHSLALGWNPKQSARAKIEGTIRFARHHLVAWLDASETRCTLKESYLRIGPWNDATFSDPDDDADFFNLQIIKTDVS
jgi:5-methylcytosine-specific restriction endonuclease McrA